MNERKEILKKIVIGLISFLGNYLYITAYVSGLALFLGEIGPSWIPMLMLGMGVLYFSVIAINVFFASSVRVDRFFIIWMVIFAVLFAMIDRVGTGNNVGIIALLLGSMMLFNILTLVFYKMVGAIVTPLQAKAYYPLANGAASAGILVGLLSSTLFEDLTQIYGIGIIATIIVLAMLAMGLLLIMVSRRELEHHHVHQGNFTEMVKEMGKSAAYVWSNKLFRNLLFAFFIITGIKILTDLKFNTVIEAGFEESELRSVLNTVFTIQNIILVVINFFLLKRILFRFGVSNSLIFYPLIYFLALVVSVATGFDYRVVAGLYMIEVISHFSYVSVSVQQVLSIAKEEFSVASYMLVKGLIFAIGMMFFSLIALVFTYDIDLEPTVNTVFLFMLSATLLYLMMRLKKDYFEELKYNLFRSDTEMRGKAIELLAEKSYVNTGENLLRKLLKMESLDFFTKSKVLYSLGVIGNYQSISDLIEVVRTGNSKEKFAAIQAINSIIRDRRKLNKLPVTKYLLLETYENLLLSGVPKYIKLEIIASLSNFNLTEVIHFLEDNLKAGDTVMKTNVIEALGTFDDRAIISYLRPYLESKDLYVSSAVVLALWKFKDQRVYLLPIFTRVLTNTTKDGQLAALFLIGSINATWERRYVEQRLEDRRKRIRHMAILTMIKLGETDYIADFIRVMLQELRRGRDKAEIEFMLSMYRKLDQKTKDNIIKRIQGMAERDVQYFYGAFKDSDYLFGLEQAELSG